ncbi:MAG: DUF805 domain-containing protein [Dehalococcoidia bacterium]
MKFDEAVRSVLGKYATFEGRAGRSEFWYWVLFTLLVQVVISVLDQFIWGAGMLGFLFSLAVLIPGIAVGVRRLHDVGKTGWLMLIGLIPIVGLYLLYLAVQPSQGPNQYGEGPAGPLARATA